MQKNNWGDDPFSEINDQKKQPPRPSNDPNAFDSLNILRNYSPPPPKVSPLPAATSQPQRSAFATPMAPKNTVDDDAFAIFNTTSTTPKEPQASDEDGLDTLDLFGAPMPKAAPQPKDRWEEVPKPQPVVVQSPTESPSSDIIGSNIMKPIEFECEIYARLSTKRMLTKDWRQVFLKIRGPLSASSMGGEYQMLDDGVLNAAAVALGLSHASDVMYVLSIYRSKEEYDMGNEAKKVMSIRSTFKCTNITSKGYASFGELEHFTVEDLAVNLGSIAKFAAPNDKKHILAQLREEIGSCITSLRQFRRSESGDAKPKSQQSAAVSSPEEESS